MNDSSGAAFREITDWPAPGEPRAPEELTLLALRLIKTNLDFIADHVPAEEGFGPHEVISLITYRAYRGGGLARSLRKHADGTDRIENVQGLLLRYTGWAVLECRGKAAARRETATDWSIAPESDVPIAEDADDNPHGFLRLIEILRTECDQALGSASPDLPAAVEHVTSRLPELLDIFRRCAPEQVYAEVVALSAQDQACVLLGVFPVELPHRAVTAYRQVTWGGNQMTPGENGGGITVGGTQKRISRLRERLRNAWPPEQLPPGIRAGDSPEPADDDPQEVS
jgi:hypothetical protein